MSVGYWTSQVYPPIMAVIQRCEDVAPGHTVASYGYWVTEDDRAPNRDRVTCSCGAVSEHQWGPHTMDVRHAQILAWRSMAHLLSEPNGGGFPLIPLPTRPFH